MDPDNESLNMSQNFLDNEDPKYFWQAIRDLMLTYGILLSRLKWMLFLHNYTWDLIDIPTNRKIIDFKWVFNIKDVPDRSVDKFKAQLVNRDFSKFRDRITKRQL
jgi:hypothetical protein